MEKVAVQLGLRSYPILIAPALCQSAAEQPDFSHLWQYKKVVVISNPVVADLYLAKVKALFSQAQVTELLIPDGEAFKTLASFEQACSFLLQQSFPSANHGVFLTFQILTLFFLSAAVAVFCCFIN